MMLTLRYLLTRRLAAIATPLVLCAGAALAQTAPALKSGEQVYAQVCAACHAAGVANAPKFGDKARWSKLIPEGQATLTAHGWVGVRAMPAKGGRPDLSLEEFSRAVVWMARAGGASWSDPDAAMMERIRSEERKRIEALRSKDKAASRS